MEAQGKNFGVVTVRTPGKVIISGEHSVVYHKPALVMAINLFTQARATIKIVETGEVGSKGVSISLK
jgi:hypothetical protein